MTMIPFSFTLTVPRSPREQFISMVKKTLRAANLNDSLYSGHCFRNGAASQAAAAGAPANFIKMLGHWEREAYQLYIRTPRVSLAAVSQLIAEYDNQHNRLSFSPLSKSDLCCHRPIAMYSCSCSILC